MSSKFIIDSSNAPRAFGPYSQAVAFGPFLFTSGILPIDLVTGKCVKSGIEEQTKIVLDHLLGILKSAGLDAKHVIKSTVYLRNRNDLDSVDAVYQRYFDYAAPARTVLEVNRLQEDALISIEAIAVAPEPLNAVAAAGENMDTEPVSDTATNLIVRENESEEKITEEKKD